MTQEKASSSRGPDLKKKSAPDKPDSFSSAKSWFFGIGINAYEHFPPLYNAVKDVKDLIILLQDKYDLESDHILTLFDKEASRRNIIRTFDQLLKEVSPEDKLLIYYSGHGHLSKSNNKGFWIPTDADKDNTAQYIRNSTVREYIEDIKSLHTLLISDSCFSGSLFVRGANRSGLAIDELEQRSSRWAICSGRHDEEVYDGKPGYNSPFAESIIDILSTNKKASLNVAKLADRIVDLTRANYKQLPEGNPLYGVGHKGGQYIFRLRFNEVADWESCQKTGTTSAYKTFLAKYPNGQYQEKARNQLEKQEENEAWGTAKKENTLLSYFKYDQKYPDGRHTDEALKAIKELEEEQKWKEAQQKNTLYTYRDYMRIYPVGKYRKDANQKIKELLQGKEEPVFWQQVSRTDTIESLRSYLDKYPQGNYVSEASIRINELEEQKRDTKSKEQEALIWQKAKQKNTISAYQGFILQFPRGQYTNEARETLKTLEEEKAGRDAEKQASDRKRIQQEKHLTAWGNAKKKDSINAYQIFLDTYPRHKNATEARQRLQELKAVQKKKQSENLRKKAPWLIGIVVLVLIGTIVFIITSRQENKSLSDTLERNSLYEAIQTGELDQLQTHRNKFPSGVYQANTQFWINLLEERDRLKRSINANGPDVINKYKDRNVLQLFLDEDGKFILSGREKSSLSLGELGAFTKQFILNPDQKKEYAENPREAIVAISKSKGSSNTIYNRACKDLLYTYIEIWEEDCQASFRIPFLDEKNMQCLSSAAKKVPFSLLTDVDAFHSETASIISSWKIDKKEPYKDLLIPKVETNPKEEGPTTDNGTSETTDEIFPVVEEGPRFPGCEHINDTGQKKKCADKKLMEFIANEIKYPQEAINKGIEGKVVLSFVVEKDGSISNPLILRNLEGGCGKEAMRVINLMNQRGIRWKPGKQRGQAVRVRYTVPVRFKL